MLQGIVERKNISSCGNFRSRIINPPLPPHSMLPDMGSTIAKAVCGFLYDAQVLGRKAALVSGPENGFPFWDLPGVT